MSKRIEELEQLLNQYNKEYYDNDTPSLSDDEYGSIKDEYMKLTGISEYAFVPGNVDNKFNKVIHENAVLSLEKTNTLDDLKNHLLRLKRGVIQYKYDGLTLIVDGKNKICSTRGNGSEGEDITETAKYVQGVNYLKNYTVRGEVILKKQDFEYINMRRKAKGLEAFKNTRNAAAGLLRIKAPNNFEIECIKKLVWVPYDILNITMYNYDNIYSVLNFNYSTCAPLLKSFDDTNIDVVIEWFKNFDRSKLEFDIDGLVVKSTLIDSRNKYGSTRHHWKDQIAYKFTAEEHWTVLRDVKYQIGRNKVTPVAIFDPIDIMGSTVSKATLHNQDYIKALDLMIGDAICVVKSNDVIPAVIKREHTNNSMPVHEPTGCPSCGSPLIKKNGTFYCVNNQCSGTLANNINHMCSKEALDIEGLSIETINKMIDYRLIYNKYDIFKLTEEDILTLPKFAKVSAKKLYKNIQGARKTTLDRFIYAAGIPLIGKNTAELIANDLKTFTNVILDIKKDCGQIFWINGVGKETVESIKENKALLVNLYLYVTPEDMESKQNNITGLNIVITGTLSYDRGHYKQAIEMRGGKLQSSVTKKTDYIVVGDAPGQTKIDRAHELGFDNKIINEDKLKDILANIANA